MKNRKSKIAMAVIYINVEDAIAFVSLHII